MKKSLSASFFSKMSTESRVPDSLANSFCEMTSCDTSTAKYYLSMANNDMNVAVGLYFDAGGAPAPLSSVEEQNRSVHWSSNRTILCEGTSQFTFEDGRSACTTIALEASFQLLKLQHDEESLSLKVSEPDFISKFVREGINQYRSKNTARAGGAEHQSCQEVLLVNTRYSETLEAINFRQSNATSPNAFYNEMKDALEISKLNGPICCIITKPPETNVVLVHPATSKFPQGHFVVFDSHPRPSLMFQGAFMIGFNSAEATASFLREVFPTVAGLGDSVMAQMYNCFDLTVLRMKKVE